MPAVSRRVWSKLQATLRSRCPTRFQQLTFSRLLACNMLATTTGDAQPAHLPTTAPQLPSVAPPDVRPPTEAPTSTAEPTLSTHPGGGSAPPAPGFPSTTVFTQDPQAVDPQAVEDTALQWHDPASNNALAHSVADGVLGNPRAMKPLGPHVATGGHAPPCEALGGANSGVDHQRTTAQQLTGCSQEMGVVRCGKASGNREHNVPVDWEAGGVARGAPQLVSLDSCSVYMAANALDSAMLDMV